MSRFPASPEKLKKLKAQGQFAKSRELDTAFLFIGSLIGFYLAKAEFLALVELFWKETSTTGFFPQASILIKIIFSLLLPISLASLLSRLIQSKFYFNPALVKLDFSRLSWKTTYQTNFAQAIAACLWLVIAYLLIKRSLTSLIVSPEILFYSFGFYCFSLAILGYFMAKIGFQNKHQMTREEVKTEKEK